jgi:hypothetical protein
MSEAMERAVEDRFNKGIYFKQTVPHREGCHMCQHSSGLDPETFIVRDKSEWRDCIGRKRRRGEGHEWIRFKCNDYNCPAVMLVRWDALARFVTEGWFV